MQPDPDPLPPLETTIARWIASNAGYDALRKQLAPYGAEMQRLRARVAELNAEVNSQRARDKALAAGEYQHKITRLEDRLAKYDALFDAYAEATKCSCEFGDEAVEVAAKIRAALAPEVT